MRRFTRIAIIAIIIAASILVGVAVDLLWGTFQRYIYPDNYLSHVQQYAYEYNVPEPLILAVIKAESNFDSRAESSAGALGLIGGAFILLAVCKPVRESLGKKFFI